MASEIQSDIGMNLSFEEQEKFLNAKFCHICEKQLTDDDDNNARVRDHDHLTGTFRGAAHNQCNLNYRLNTKIPVIYHGLKHYDGHVILKEAKKELAGYNIDVIPSNSESYLSFSIGQFQFIDSLQFMQCSLEKLVNNVKADQGVNGFPILKQIFRNGDDQQLLLRKGVFPYEYLTGPEKFMENTLPPQTAFYSKLRKEQLSDEDYSHAWKVWKYFKMETFREYHDLYLK